MTVKRLLFVLGLMAGLAGVAYVAREAEGPPARMATAAEKFVASLDKKQKAKALFAFEDRERLRWYFTPKQAGRKPLRKGLPLSEMSDEQKKLAFELVRAGTSAKGYLEATAIVNLETVLANLEKKGAMVRDPDWYFVSIFGRPSKAGKWGWRFEGHHLSLNFTLDGGKVVSATPALFGANPAVIKSGPDKGKRTLAASQDDARALWAALDEAQRKLAFRKEQFPEIAEGTVGPKASPPVGLPGSKMDDKQKGLLLKLIEGYANRLMPEVASRELAEVKKAGLDSVHVAFGGGHGTPGKPYTYRVQGPTFLIEFLNEQRDSAGNPANHIHSGWRRPGGDFGVTAP
jgi:hypothetical protein